MELKPKELAACGPVFRPFTEAFLVRRGLGDADTLRHMNQAELEERMRALPFSAMLEWLADAELFAREAGYSV
jgi:hypothetical protein